MALRVSASVPTSSRISGSGRRRDGVAGALDLARAGGEAAQRAQGAAGEDGGQRGGQQRGDERGEQHEAARAVERVLDLGGGAGHDHGAARGGSAAELAQRRRVDAQRVGAEARVAVAGRAVLERAGGGGGVGQDAAAEPARAGDDPPARVDHLHEQRAAAEPALERAGLGEQLRGGGGEPGDLGGARPQRAVERVVELVVEPREHGDAEGRDGHHDGHRGGGRHACLEAHSSLKPTPRTVWMSGGSPSLRRR